MTRATDSSLRRDFQVEGFVSIPAFIGSPSMVVLNENLTRFIRDIVPTLPPEQAFYEDKRRPETLKQIQSLHEHDDYFAKLFVGGAFEKLAASLLHERVVGKNLQYFNKPPGVGQPTPPHQDGYYFNLDPPEAVTMWLALDEVDQENGCVRYVRGSHRWGMRPHARTQVLGFSQGISDYGQPEDSANEIAFPAHPGDLLAHHALTIHRADGNVSSSRSRRSLGFVYFAASAREDSAAAAQYQKRLKQELLATNRI